MNGPRHDAGSVPVSAPVRLSVVVPAYNEEDYLEAALRSLQRQDYAGGFEVIVVDNNSSDATAEIARSLGVRVVHEDHAGVCAARQRGTVEARGDIVVSTDADTVHPTDWLTRVEAQFTRRPDAIAVAGPCRYLDPPWWAAVFPPLWFRAVAAVYAVLGRVFYITATNFAFRRSDFPGYDTSLTQGGDEADVLRRLQGLGPVVWDADNAVLTSSRRMDQGLGYTLVVSFGYHYALNYVLNRLAARRVLGVAPAIRLQQADEVRRRRRRWRVGALVLGATLTVWRRARADDPLGRLRLRPRPLGRASRVPARPADR